MSKNIDQAHDVPDLDPFSRIIAMLSSHFNYFFNMVSATCGNRWAFRLERPNIHYHTYVLVDPNGADGVTGSTMKYQQEFPAPSTFRDFDKALKEGRKLSATAGISFQEYDPIFTQCSQFHGRIQMMMILPPSAAEMIGGRRIGPMALDRVLLEERLAWQPLFDRVVAIGLHVQGMGLLNVPLEVQETQIVKPRPTKKKNPKSTARNKWIYQQCCKGIEHSVIALTLKKIAPKRGWIIVSSKQRIQQIGNEYADENGLDRPPSRRDL
jgi:hypothetical protein